MENRSSDKNLAPSILKAITVPRRFSVDRQAGRVSLQFGYGSESEITKNVTCVILKQKHVIIVKVLNYYVGPKFGNFQNYENLKTQNT